MILYNSFHHNIDRETASTVDPQIENDESTRIMFARRARIRCNVLETNNTSN